MSNKCGGCSFGILEYRDEISLKKDVIKREFTRALKQKNIIGNNNIIVFPSPKKWGYRWRGQVYARHGSPHFMQLNSNKLEVLNQCLLFSSPINERLPHIVRGIEDKKVVICASPYNHKVFTHMDVGPLILPFYAYDLYLEIMPGSFFQANWDLNQALIDFVVGKTHGFDVIADLYAGCGNFSIPLAKLEKKVIAIENNIHAIYALQNFCTKNGFWILIKKKDLFKDPCISLLNSEKVECIVVDPPRSGGGKFISHIPELKYIKRIIWVSCDIVNTARDLNPILRAGWEIKDIALFDMFPRTFHMEVVLILDKKQGKIN